MNRLELIEILSSSDEEEVLHKEETFDGCYTAFPAAIVLKPKNSDYE